MAVNGEGLDYHGAGAVRFDTKYEGGPAGEGGERYHNYVRLVRTISATDDSVGDGIPDAWRLKYFGSATTTNATSCAAGDPDTDGTSNYNEYVADTNPTNALLLPHRKHHQRPEPDRVLHLVGEPCLHVVLPHQPGFRRLDKHPLANRHSRQW